MHLKELQEKLTNLPLDAELFQGLQEREALEERIRTTTNAKRREAQRLLERWKDTHIGPKWSLAEQRYTNRKNLQKEIAVAETTL